MTDAETGSASAGLRRVADRLTDGDRAAATALLEAVTEADGTAPFSEDARLALAHGRAGAVHLLWRDEAKSPDDGTQSPAGYLYLGPADDSGDRTAELCVAPRSRRRGIARKLIEAALGETPGTLRVWAHGSLPGSAQLAEAAGFTAVRELRLLALSTTDAEGRPRAFEPPPAPAGVEVSTFRPGEDEEPWLAVNARAFAHHPEQGRWTRQELAEREAEPWFDPAGFFLARAVDGAAAGRLLGFHWTKVHPAGAYGPGPVGEIYVLGVDPEAGGRGLGRLLALIGLRHLARSGLDAVVLYVDGSNTSAVRLYESLGFESRTVDMLYERRGSG